MNATSAPNSRNFFVECTPANGWFTGRPRMSREHLASQRGRQRHAFVEGLRIVRLHPAVVGESHASSMAELATEPQRAAVARLLHVRRTTHAGACRRNGARPDRRSESRFREEAADQQRAPMTSEPEPGRLRSLFAPALASSSKLPQVHLTSALGSDVWRRGRSSRRLRSSKPSRGPCAAVMHGTAGSRPSGLNGAEACLRTRRGRPPP